MIAENTEMKPAHKQDLQRRAIDLVNTSYSLRNMPIVDLDLRNRKVARILQILASDDHEQVPPEEDQIIKASGALEEIMPLKDDERYPLGVGMDEAEAVNRQYIMFTELAQFPIEYSSPEEEEKGLEHNPDVNNPDSKDQSPKIIEQSKELNSQSTAIKTPCFARYHTRSAAKNQQNLKPDIFLGVLEVKIENEQDFFSDVTPEYSLESEQEEIQPTKNVTKSKLYVNRTKKKSLHKQKQCFSKETIHQRECSQTNMEYTLENMLSCNSFKPKGRKPEYPDMEKKLVYWINRTLEKQTRLTQSDIRMKARKIMEKSDCPSRFTFRASKGWMEKFFRRHPTIFELIAERNSRKVHELESYDNELQLYESKNLMVKEE